MKMMAICIAILLLCCLLQDKNKGIVEHTPFLLCIPENGESVRGSMKNEERNVATKWRFCKEKHVCVMWNPLFAGTNPGVFSIARSVCIMYRPVGIWMFCRK
jgi:hypothetical protein